MCLACLHSPERKVTTRIRSSLRGENKIKKKRQTNHHHRSPACSCIVFSFLSFFLSYASFRKIAISLPCSLSLVLRSRWYLEGYTGAFPGRERRSPDKNLLNPSTSINSVISMTPFSFLSSLEIHLYRWALFESFLDRKYCAIENGKRALWFRAFLDLVFSFSALLYPNATIVRKSNGSRSKNRT